MRVPLVAGLAALVVVLAACSAEPDAAPIDAPAVVAVPDAGTSDAGGTDSSGDGSVDGGGPAQDPSPATEPAPAPSVDPQQSPSTSDVLDDPTTPIDVPDPEPAVEQSTEAPVCDTTPNLVLYIRGGQPNGTGAVIIAEPGEGVGVLVDSDTAGELVFPGTSYVVPVEADNLTGGCLVFERGVFPMQWQGSSVATIDTTR